MSNSDLNQTKNQAFTLIEVLVVTGIAGLLMITVGSMFITFMGSSSQTKVKQQIKMEGNEALSKMEHLLRNAQKLSANNSGNICQTGMDSIGFESFAGGKGILFQNDNRIASDSGIIEDFVNTQQTYFLTSEQLSVDSTYPLTFDCYQGDKSYFVQINFGLEATNTQGPSNRDLTQTFKTAVQLRNLAQTD